MKDIRLVISASVDAAEREVKKLERTGEQVSDRLSGAFETLGTKSTLAMEQQKNNVNKAYDSIKNSGVATADELTRAEKSRADKIAAIDEEMFGKRTTLLDKFKANWMAITAAIAVAWVAVSQAWGMAKESAMGLQQRASFANLATSHGAVADSIIADLKRASGETVATKDIIEKAGTAMLLGIPADKLSRLMEIARASSRVTGETITKSYEDISLAVARGSRMILDNLGIIISEEKAYKDYAATLKKSADQLTDAEKKQAFMNATLAAGDDIIKRVGITGMTTAEKMQRFEARMKNLKEIVGVGLLATLSAVQGALNLAASGALYLSGGIFKVVQGIAWLTGQTAAVDEWRANADAAFGAAKDLAKDGLGDLSTAMDLVTGKVDPLNGKTKQMEDAAKSASEAEQKRKEVLKSAAEALNNYAKSVSNLGKEQLKLAEGGFSRDLQRQEDYFKKNQTLAANLAAPLKNYLDVLDTVYGRQLTAQKEIEAVLKRIGAGKKVQLEQQALTLQVEKSHAEASLKGWNDYLGKLKSMHSSAMDDIKKKQDELLALQESGKETQKALQDKFFPKPPQVDPYLDFWEKLDQADASQAEAMKLSGDKRIEAIKKSIDLLKTLPEQVTEGDDILISRTEAYERIATRAKEWQSEAEAAKQAQLDSSKVAAKTLAEEMARTETAIQGLERQIVSLDNQILALSRTVTLTLDDQVTAGVENIRKALESIVGSGATVSRSTVTYTNVIPGAVSLSSPINSWTPLATGTNYVPHDNFPALLHRGEAVVPAKYNNGGSGGLTMAAGAIQVIVQGGGPVDVDAMVDAIGRKLVPKMDEYARRRRAA